jgi:hypothetical protein
VKRLLYFALIPFFLLTTFDGQEPMGVCGLLKSANRYDHKTVVVSGFVYADHHWTLIEEKGCSGGIVISYDSDLAPHDFVDGVEAKRGRFASRPFQVTVEGKFSSRVKGPLGYLRRIEVTKVLHWEFADAAPENHAP